MVHHQRDIFLCQTIKRGPFRKDPADQFVVDLTGTFLIRTARIAVKDIRAAKTMFFRRKFNCFRIGKLTSIIRQDDRKEPAEIRPPKQTVQPVEDVCNRSGGVSFPQVCQHKAGIHEMDSKQDLPTSAPNNRIHLYHAKPGIIDHELLIILITPSDTAAPVHLEFRFLIPGTVLYLSGKINVPDIKQAGINVIVKSLLAAHQLICMVLIDLMDRLAVTDQGADQAIDTFQLCLTGEDPAPGFRDCFFLRIKGSKTTGCFCLNDSCHHTL